MIFSLQFERKVNQDNTVSIQKLALQIEAVRWRATLAGCTVIVHQHLEGTFTITYGLHRIGHYGCDGLACAQKIAPAARAVEKPRAGKVKEPTFPARLEIPQTTRDSRFPTAPATAGLT